MKKISFVILTWNSDQTIETCLQSIAHICGSQNIPYEIIVVDNGSSDSTVSIVDRNTAAIPIHLIQMPKNMGTTHSRNLALRTCTGDIICVMDSDAVLLEGNIRDVADILGGDDSIGILAPKLILTDGTAQHSVRKFPSAYGKFSRIPAIIFKLRLPNTDHYTDFPFTQPTDIDYAISACWFFRRNLLDSVGYLDERIFYAPEDVDYCIRIWKMKKRVVFYPYFTVLHHVQRITHKSFFSRIALSHLFGLIYYFLKHRYITTPKIRRTPSDASHSGISGMC
ncbi:MAG: glycosyltransferase [Candidatus Latescibacterota bacterium]